MEYYFYCITIFFSIVLFFIRKDISVNQLAMYSTLIFSVPLITGSFYDRLIASEDSISRDVYLLYFIPTLIFGMFSLTEHFLLRKKQVIYNEKSTHKFMLLLCVMGLISLVFYQYIHLATNDFTLHKKSDLQVIPFGLLLFNFLTCLGLSLSMMSRRYTYVMFIVSAALIMFFMTKSRSAFTFSIVLFCFIYIMNSQSLISKFKVIFLGFSGFLFVILFNGLVGILLKGDIHLLSILFDQEYYRTSFSKMEPHTNIMLASYTLKENLLIDSEVFWSGLINIIPFGQTLFNVEYTKWSILIRDFLGASDGPGVAGNVYAQIWSVFGYLGVISFCLFCAIVNSILYVCIKYSNSLIKLSSLPLLPVCGFFFVRTDFWATISVLINTMVLVLVIYVVASYVCTFLKSVNKQ